MIGNLIGHDLTFLCLKNQYGHLISVKPRKDENVPKLNASIRKGLHNFSSQNSTLLPILARFYRAD